MKLTIANLIEIASGLDEYNLEKLCDYAAFLKYASQREDEPEVDFEDLKAKLINI